MARSERMTLELLAEEAQRLARRCEYLVAGVSAGQAPVGVWGGPGPPASRTVGSHRLSIAPARLAPLADARLSGGCVSLYTSVAGEEVTVTTSDEDLLPALLGDRAGTPLVARSAVSLPPLDAVFRFGSPAVQRWLDELGWLENGTPHPYNDNFPDPEPAIAYERLWQRELPLYTGGVHAIVGGWHFPWPDGDWVERLADRLLLWTLEDAEPWVELWQTPNGALRAVERVT